MRSIKKQNGSMSLSSLLVILIIFIGIIALGNRFFRPELYDDANDFQSNLIRNGKVVAQIQYLKWYDNNDSTNYYIFTDKGKLYVDGSSDLYGWWNPDEKFFDHLEEYQGMFCTLNIEDTFFHSWSVTSATNCMEQEDFYYKVKNGFLDMDGNLYSKHSTENVSNSDVPTSSPIESDVPSSTNYSDVPD